MKEGSREMRKRIMVNPDMPTNPLTTVNIQQCPCFSHSVPEQSNNVARQLISLFIREIPDGVDGGI
jgi:hypothetical protein